MEEPRLQLNKINCILNESLDNAYYPMSNAIVSTEDWFMIFACKGLNCGQLQRFFFANNEWRTVNSFGLPKFFEHVTLFLLGEWRLVVHGISKSDGGLYKTYIGDLTEEIVYFQIIGILDTNVVKDIMYEHQIVGVSIDRMYLVHGYRKNHQSLAVYKLNLTSKNWVVINKSSMKYMTSNINISPKNRVLYYDNKLYVFAAENHKDELTRLHRFDLCSLKWRTMLTKAEGPVHGMPTECLNTAYALAAYEMGVSGGQRRYAFLVGQCPRVFWRLDLQTLRWASWPIYGPPEWFHGSGPLTVTVTSTGRLYADDGCGRVYATWVEQPPAEDQQWDATLSRHRKRIFGRDDMSDRQLYHVFGLPRRLAVKIRQAHTGVYEG